VSLRLLSWNLFGLSDDHLDLRTEAAMFEALLGGRPEVVLARRGAVPPPPDVLLFQEVVARSHVAHLRPHLTAAGYTVFPEAPHAEREYYEVIAVRPPLRVQEGRVVPLDSAQGRELVMVRTLLGDVPWLWMTAHLESLELGARQRLAQVPFVLAQLRAHDGPAVFGGDTNLRESEVAVLEEEAPLPDAWEACGAPPGERFTRISGRSGRGQRYDRIWGSGVRFQGFRGLGRDPVTPSGDPPSDHLGVTVQVRAR
jgi:endonuclease/exonuclease/phosphatase family metal-dependent hydrolase